MSPTDISALLSLSTRQLVAEDWSDSSDVDPFRHQGTQLDRHSSIGVNSSDLVRSLECWLQLVRQPEMILLPHHLSNCVVMSDPFCVLLEQPLVDQELPVVSDGYDVCNEGYVQKHVPGKS